MLSIPRLAVRTSTLVYLSITSLLLFGLVTQFASPRLFRSEPAAVVNADNAFIIASVKKDDIKWIEMHFPTWKKYRYIVDDSNAEYTVPQNKGRESMVYLTFIIDHYDNLPARMVFQHPDRWQWHNDDPEYDGLPPLQNLQWPYIESQGYVNLRCVWVIGCPSEIEPIAAPKDPASVETRPTAFHYAKAFNFLFPGKEVPEIVAVSCCAQFAVTRSKVLERPKADYERYREWLLATELEDGISGRILEFSWHIIFGREAIFCPKVQDCYCNVFGLCDLTCPDDSSCEGRYILPPFSTMPKKWPTIGWDGKPRTPGQEFREKKPA